MANTGATGGGMFEWLKENPPLVIGGVVIGAVVIFGLVLKPKNPATSTPNSNLGGLTNGNLVYVPTSTSFTTENINKGTNIGNTTTTTTTTTGGGVCRPGYHFLAQHLGLAVPDGSYSVSGGYCIPNATTVPTPPRKPPAPPPNPPKTTKGLVWDQRYTIMGGQDLSGIASILTTRLRAQGMPGSQSITWHDLYAHNTSVINEQAAAHHNPIPGGPWNDVFPGEVITVPRWG